MNNLNRLYNQNRKGIWWIIIIVTFFFIIFRITINFIIEKNREDNKNVQNSNTIYDSINDEKVQLSTDKSVVSGDKLSSNKLEEEVGTIKTFLEYCNNQKIEEAYNMLTDECKEEMYSNINEFYEYYYKNVFEETRISFEVENWTNDTYKINIIPDMLATGKSNNGRVKQDYITTKKVEKEYKLNINNYIGRKQINKSKEQNGVTITVNYRDAYMEHEYYNITVKNNRAGKIILDDLKSNTMYLEDNKDVRYGAYTNEIVQELLEIDSGMQKNMKIKFYKRYSSTSEVKDIIFSKVIVDYEKYINSIKEGIENIKINL